MINKMQKRTYAVETYDPAWVKKFNDLRETLQKIFGSKALAIEHVGSTSVPGMSAKPVIDVLIIVQKMEPFADERKAMAKLAYESADNYIAPESIVFFKTKNGDMKIENIHVCVKDSPKAIQFITTRDFLRSHPERARTYSNLKLKLKKEFPNDYPAYRAGKQSFLDETERLTKEWLTQTT